MKSKKSPKSDLERKRGLFLEIGLVLALGLCLAAFEWPSSETKIGDLGNLSETVDMEEEILNTFIKEPPPPPEIEEPEIEDPQLKVVENDVQTEKIDFSSEIKEKSAIKIKKKETIELPEEEDEPIIFYLVEDQPEFPGGEKAMLQFIGERSEYPEEPRRNGVDGTVHVQFVVESTGEISNAFIVGSVDPYLDAEALRLVSLFPNWIPGKQRGIAVRVTKVLPIKFKLE